MTKYQKYEQLKRELQQKALSHTEYERELKKISKKLAI